MHHHFMLKIFFIIFFKNIKLILCSIKYSFRITH